MGFQPYTNFYKTNMWKLLLILNLQSIEKSYQEVDCEKYDYASYSILYQRYNNFGNDFLLKSNISSKKKNNKLADSPLFFYLFSFSNSFRKNLYEINKYKPENNRSIDSTYLENNFNIVNAAAKTEASQYFFLNKINKNGSKKFNFSR